MQIDELPSYTIVAAATNHPELLDRAAWRRFQLRLNLPMPSQKDLAQYISLFMARFEEPIGLSPGTIAKALGKISYAEAEQFCLDVRRRQILSAGQKRLKNIVDEQLSMWTSKARARQSSQKEEDNARASSASPSES